MDESRIPISCANCSHTYGGYCNLTGKDFEDELSRRNKDCPSDRKNNLQEHMTK